MMNRIYTAVTQSPAWRSAVLVINFDEWGGFFDHVPPPVAPIPPADQAAGNADGRLGFRTPTLLISPFAPRQHTSHIRYDHTSVLRMIEWRWGLDPLTVRDATANNLAVELDFTQVIPALRPATSSPPSSGRRVPSGCRVSRRRHCRFRAQRAPTGRDCARWRVGTGGGRCRLRDGVSYGCEAPASASAVQKALNTASDQCPRHRSICVSAAGRENAGR